MEHFDLIIIGAGPGGYEAALRAADLGLRTALVERREVGGTCLNRGCIPTKSLLHAAALYRELRSGAPFGVTAKDVSADLSTMFARKEQVTAQLRTGVEGLLKRAGVTLLQGTGTVLAPGRVRVSGQSQAEYSCGNLLIATGSVPARPPIPGLELEGVLTSDELLAAPRDVSSLVIIGGGVIGVEFATFYNDLGCQVTVLEGLDRLLPGLDRELGQSLGLLFKRRGVSVQTGAMVRSVAGTENGLAVHYETKNGLGTAQAGAVLCAIGRRPYTEGLFAPGVTPDMEGHRIQVDSRFRTSLPGVYAIGDVSSKVQLAHAATAQGVACVEMLCGSPPIQDLRLVPSCVYCRPEIASVGLSEAEAKAADVPVAVGKGLTSGNGRSVIAGSDRGFLKLVAHRTSGVLLGAQLLCDRATDILSELTLAMANGLTVWQLLRAIRPHPTFEEALGDALEALCQKLS